MKALAARLTCIVVLGLVPACGFETRAFNNPSDPKCSGNGCSQTLGGGSANALSFGSNIKIAGVTGVRSAAMLSGMLYFTGSGVGGANILGTMKPTDTSPTITSVTQLSGNGITLSTTGTYFLASNTLTDIYLVTNDPGGSTSIQFIEVDRTSLKATTSHLSANGVANGTVVGQSVFEENGQWQVIGQSHLWACSMTDGSTIGAPFKPITDASTGAGVELDTFGPIYFDGATIFQYSPVGKTLAAFNAGFARQGTDSTSSYPYNGMGASNNAFVSDGNGNLYFFGCDANNGCYLTKASVASP